ncbi:hypothetical protein SPIROBIBN47_180052 [uncultured spirochete]|jgi:hypothetical protein|uniref:Uncharacterized protein n=1 Tax=uncultured spirochete TaxID=156406 RepID=A0A3P3XGL7_9SPIR|nr:hypothetical protein SPIROBIBN47_180052 [uncultured spirochete]
MHMLIDIKILHLHRPIYYEKIELVSDEIQNNAISALAARYGECLLVFRNDNLLILSDDGPHLASKLVPSTAYRIAVRDGGKGSTDTASAIPDESQGNIVGRSAPRQLSADYSIARFTLSAADYAFFQWRAESAPQPSIMFEEFAREIWWERLETEGAWFLRLVLEDGKTSVQALRLVLSTLCKRGH